MSEERTGKEKRLELSISLLIVIFAAVLAIVDLYAGKYGDDEIIAQNEKAAAYDWYQSKSIKQTLIEGEKQMLSTLQKAGAIKTEDTAAIATLSNEFSKEASKYKKEKNEILIGSEKIGKENWIQDKDGELGKIKGAKEWEEEARILGNAGDKFDLSTLYLQLCLVFGAISLVLQSDKIKYLFISATALFGITGIYYAYLAFQIVSQV